MVLSKRKIVTISIVAMIGALGGVLADLFSAWSITPNTMSTAISIDIESITGLYADKSRWAYVLGTYLGIFFIPFHWFGFYLVHHALRPAGKLIAITFLILSCYVVAIGAGFHGTLAFIGDTILSGNNELLENMMQYWQVWGIVMIVGYVAVSLFLLILIVSGKTMYSRKVALLSPLSLMIVSTVLIALLPEQFYGTKNFFAVTGFNLPLFVFYIVTLKTLLNNSDITSKSI